MDRIQSLHRYVREHLDSGVARVRIIDESVWPTDSTAAVSELKRFESICNLHRHPARSGGAGPVDSTRAQSAGGRLFRVLSSALR